LPLEVTILEEKQRKQTTGRTKEVTRERMEMKPQTVSWGPPEGNAVKRGGGSVIVIEIKPMGTYVILKRDNNNMGKGGKSKVSMEQKGGSESGKARAKGETKKRTGRDYFKMEDLSGVKEKGNVIGEHH